MLGFGPIADSPVAAEPDRWGQPPIGWKTTASLWGSAGFGYAFPAGPATAVAGGMKFDWANSGFSADPTASQMRGFNVRVRAGYTYTVTVVGDGTGSGAQVRATVAFLANSSLRSPSSTAPMVVAHTASSNGTIFVGVSTETPSNGIAAGSNFTVASISVVEALGGNATFDTSAGSGTAAGGATSFDGQLPRLIESTETLWTSATTAYNVTAPATLTENDLLWVQFVNADTGGSFTTVPSGWTQHVPVLNATGGNMITAYWHVVTAGEAASPPATFNFVWSSSLAGNAHLAVFRNVDTTTPVDVVYASVTNGTATKTVPSITTVTDGALVIGGAQLQSASSQSVNVPSGWYEIQNSSTQNAGRGGVLGLEGNQIPAGAAGTAAFTQTSALNGYAYQVALRPASTGSNGTFVGSTGGEVAGGGSTSMTGDAALVGSLGGESAAGGSSTLSGNATFTTNAGGESAAGGSSTYTGDAAFATSASGDTASGGSTSFSGSGSPDATFDTVAGGESASGGSSSLTGDGSFSTVVASAPADGGSTTATGTATFTTNASADTADGGSGSMSGASPAAAWVGNGISAASAGTVNVTLPTWAAGTTGVILVAAEAATNGNTCSTPTGYTYVTDFISNSSSRMYLFRKDMADGDSGATVALSWSGSNRIAGAAVVVKNATWDTFATQGAGSGSSISIPTVTAGGTDGMTVAFYGGRTDLGDVTTEFSAAPSGYSNAQGISTTTGGGVRNVLLGSAVLTFSSATVAATTATTTASLNSRAGIAVTLLGSALTGDGSFSTVVGSGTADGGSSTFTGSAGNGTFTTSVGTATASGNPTSFVTAVADATFWTTTTLSWAPPDTTGWTVRTVNATENPITLNDSTDYVIQFSATRTVTCDIKGGRNLVIRNPRIGGRKTAPALTSSYDGPNRGLRIQDGANANNDRTIWIEGLYVEPGTYQSDTIQVALRTENRVKIVIQNFNDLGINWGNNVTSPNVHADALQTYGGPTTLWVDGFYAAHCTYQGIIINPDDGRTAPTGTPEDWIFRRVHLAGDNLTGNGVRYLLWNSLPAGWNIVQDDVYTTGSTRNATDSSGKWPASSELRQQTQPPYDIVCQGLWDDNGIYTSPGYVTATASGGVTSFTNSPVATFSTVAGDAAAESGGDTSFVASSPGTSVTFTTLADVNTASGGTASWAVQSPQDAFFLSNVANATAAGSLGNLVPGVLLGYRVDLFIERPRTRLFGTYEGLTAYKKEGVWSITTSPQDDVLASADYVVRGGYDTVVSQAVGEELLGQGYGTLTPVYGP